MSISGRTNTKQCRPPGRAARVGAQADHSLHCRSGTAILEAAKDHPLCPAGTLPDFSLIEPNMLSGHGDYHPAFGRSFSDTVDLAMDAPSSMLSGEAFLQRVYRAYRSATSPTGANVWNTPLLIGWDEPGGTYDHVPPGPVPPPDRSAPPGEFGFTFDRSGYRVPAVIVSPWVEPGSVYNQEYRHTSLIATLRKTWGLGQPFTQRDASARTFDHVFSRATPRDPQTWAAPSAHPVPSWTMDSRSGRPGPEYPRQRHRTRPHHQSQADGSAAPGRTQRPASRPSTPAHRHRPQADLRQLLPTPSRRRKGRRMSPGPGGTAKAFLTAADGQYPGPGLVTLVPTHPAGHPRPGARGRPPGSSGVGR